MKLGPTIVGWGLIFASTGPMYGCRQPNTHTHETSAQEGEAALSPEQRAELALVQVAHRTLGDDKDFREETISMAGDLTKVCGEFSMIEKPSQRYKYTFSIYGAEIFPPEREQAWKDKCNNGWLPGTAGLR